MKKTITVELTSDEHSIIVAALLYARSAGWINQETDLQSVLAKAWNEAPTVAA